MKKITKDDVTWLILLVYSDRTAEKYNYKQKFAPGLKYSVLKEFIVLHNAK